MACSLEFYNGYHCSLGRADPRSYLVFLQLWSLYTTDLLICSFIAGNGKCIFLCFMTRIFMLLPTFSPVIMQWKTSREIDILICGFMKYNFKINNLVFHDAHNYVFANIFSKTSHDIDILIFGFVKCNLKVFHDALMYFFAFIFSHFRAIGITHQINLLIHGLLDGI